MSTELALHEPQALVVYEAPAPHRWGLVLALALGVGPDYFTSRAAHSLTAAKRTKRTNSSRSIAPLPSRSKTLAKLRQCAGVTLQGIVSDLERREAQIRVSWNERERQSLFGVAGKRTCACPRQPNRFCGVLG